MKKTKKVCEEDRKRAQRTAQIRKAKDAQATKRELL